MSAVVRSLRQRRQRGVSIVEALVALVVLSVGMLGIAVMYLESVRANRTALSRTLAVHLVNDMADRIRANRMARSSYAASFGTAPVAPKTDCSKNDCTAADLAAYDLRNWYDAVVKSLPQGADGKTVPEVEVKYNGGATSNDPARYTVTARWKDVGGNDYLVTRLEFTTIGST
jgi:type IV pilus assembly protein PilV